MKKTLARWLEDAWYKEMYLSIWLVPLSMIYVDVVRLRRFLYRKNLLTSVRLPVPVIIVGNITVGGTGKTPLVVWLVAFLRRQGFKPGVISRGYAGDGEQVIQRVTETSNAAEVGDEPLLLARRCACPVVIGADRPAAARHLLAENDCDIIVSDDGLQHYALQRDIEIAVIDGQRRFGNLYCLPAGPLREPPERIKQVDLVAVNGGNNMEPGEYRMECRGDRLINLVSGEQKPLADFVGLACHAVAGIGNPSRFFAALQAAGLNCECLAFPDHHPFTAADLNFKDGQAVIMTEKDAVKCSGFADSHHWYLPIDAELPEAFSEELLTLIEDKIHGQKIA